MSENESLCGDPAAYRYTWPGRDESYVCQKHSSKLVAVAEAMGLYLQLMPVSAQITCRLRVWREEK